jgi:hypothetical protein
MPSAVSRQGEVLGRFSSMSEYRRRGGLSIDQNQGGHRYGYGYRPDNVEQLELRLLTRIVMYVTTCMHVHVN